MISKPENWIFYNKNIIDCMKEGRDACLKAIKELERSGWIKSTMVNSRSGSHKEYFIYINPREEEDNAPPEKEDNPPLEYQGTFSPPSKNQDAFPPKNQKTSPPKNQDTNKYLSNNTKNNTNICGDESPRGCAMKKGKKENMAHTVFESYRIFYYRITGKYSKLKFLTDTKRACSKIVSEYKALKPEMDLDEFAYKVFGGNYLRLESMGTDHKLRISTAGNYVGKSIEFIDENDIKYDFENAKNEYLQSLQEK